MNGERDV